MNEKELPAGWDDERIKRLARHYEEVSDEELAAEDQAAASEQAGQSVISVPEELLPVIRQLLADHQP